MSAAGLFDWDAWPLIPAVVQDPETLQILMVGFMNREALQRSLATGHVTFYSRSRQALWTKGETSGNYLQIAELRVNCEENSLLVLAHPHGPTCHTGYQSCYFRRIESDGSLTVILERPDDASITDDSPDAQTTSQWYGAYEYLRDNDLSAISGTSKRLRDPDFPFESRIADELRELAGVLDGTHSHHGLIGDVLLEGSQIAYWTACLAVRSGVTWGELRPDQHLATAEAFDSMDIAAEVLRTTGDDWSLEAVSSPLVERCQHILHLIAAACVTAGVDPLTLIRRDLDDLKERDYLAPYFSD